MASLSVPRVLSPRLSTRSSSPLSSPGASPLLPRRNMSTGSLNVKDLTHRPKFDQPARSPTSVFTRDRPSASPKAPKQELGYMAHQTAQQPRATTFAINMFPAKVLRLDHYQVKTMLQAVWEKFQDENLFGGLEAAEFLLAHANKDTVKNYFIKTIEDNDISWEQLDHVYNELADLVDNKTDSRWKWQSVQLIQQWVLPYLLTPSKLSKQQPLITEKHQGNGSIVEMLKKEGIHVIQLGSHILVPKRFALKWIDMLEEQGFLITSVSSWGDERGILTEIRRGLDAEELSSANNRKDPALLHRQANEAREFFFNENIYDEVQYASTETSDSVFAGIV